MCCQSWYCYDQQVLQSGYYAAWGAGIGQVPLWDSWAQGFGMYRLPCMWDKMSFWSTDCGSDGKNGGTVWMLMCKDHGIIYHLYKQSVVRLLEKLQIIVLKGCLRCYNIRRQQYFHLWAHEDDSQCDM